MAATTGLLDKMNRAELQGVMAHEMAHVVYDTDDATAAHVDAVARVAADVILSYAMR